ncbi:hypothetical protein AB1484_13705 [Parafrankia sp. FMc6]
MIIFGGVVDDPVLRAEGSADAATFVASVLIEDQASVVGCQASADISGGAVCLALSAATPVATQGRGEGAAGVLLALSEAADVWQCMWQRGPPEGHSNDQKWTSGHVCGRSWTVWTGLKSGRSAV